MTPPYESSVFINCPFDPAYRPLFEAVLFAVYDCGFHVRCALEVEDSTQVRIEKITRMIRQSRLAIHDISRTQLDRRNRLPRFNMPLELGMFLGAKSFGGREQRRKAAIVLDADRYRYQKFISDIAGHDIRAHGGSPDRAIEQVRAFLCCHCPDETFLPDAVVIAARYRNFRRWLPLACRELNLHAGRLGYRDLARLVASWLATHPLPLNGSAAAAKAA